MDSETLQSAYDYARRAVESAQISEARALVKDFRKSETYQWGRGHRTVETDALESSHREAVEHQATADRSTTKSRELARAAQFMLEWSSGAQTDFTNYAARRLSERGLLREEDPIRLQRTVAGIARAYARGGHVDLQFIPGDSASTPHRVSREVLGWTTLSLPDEVPGPAERASVSIAGRRHDSAVSARLHRTGTRPGSAIPDDVKRAVDSQEAATDAVIEGQRLEMDHEQGMLSRSYNRNVSREGISPRHGGNPAIHETVGAQLDNRADLGSEPPAPALGDASLIPGTTSAGRSKDDPERKSRPRAGASDAW